MRDACQALEKVPSSTKLVGDRSFRILIPRLLPGLYEIRNNRGVGHIGGDVNPNLMDATAVYNLASWILAELVRIFHGVSTRDAQEVVNGLVERKSSLIWEIEDVKRVLDPKMPIREQVLLLLHQKLGWLSDKELVSWTEYSNATVFRAKVLTPLHEFGLLSTTKETAALGFRRWEFERWRKRSLNHGRGECNSLRRLNPFPPPPARAIRPAR